MEINDRKSHVTMKTLQKLAMPRAVLHVDMDAFFASVEQRVNPALQGRPVAVCGANARTVVLTASYEARAYGVKTGMMLHEAKALCPALILVEGDHTRYTDTCRRLLEIFQRYTPLVELFSVDEAFLDVTRSAGLFGPAETIARMIKARVRRALGLIASVGIAPNKLLAKLASGLRKPDGLMTVRPEEISGLLESLPVEELCGIGPSIARQLAALGITTCGQLGRAPAQLLTARFGIVGRKLSAMGRGEDDAPVVEIESAAGGEPEVKSIGHSMTLERNLRDPARLEHHLFQLSEMVGRRLRKHGFLGQVVTVTLRYADFQTFTRQQRLGAPVHDDLEIYRAARAIFRRVRLTDAVRLVGVGLSGLVKGSDQLSLYDDHLRRQRLLGALDAVNDRHGARTLSWGTLLQHRDGHRAVISPAWRPNGTKAYC